MRTLAAALALMGAPLLWAGPVGAAGVPAVPGTPLGAARSHDGAGTPLGASLGRAGPGPGPAIPACRGGADYYAFELVTTRNLPGSGYASGTVEVTFESSPFGVAVSSDGSYRYDLNVRVERMKAPRGGVLVAWVATRELDRVQRLGVLDEAFTASGSVDWNKYIVVVSHEAGDDPDQERWSGPIALRGMSRSGMMHTMAGHGAFQQENCAAYGY